jgi:pSer/pThr/pTyr-binding forkhead associated (FHA) protein
MAKKFNLKIIEGNNVDTVFEIDENTRYEIRRMPPEGIPGNIDRKTAIFITDAEASKLHANLTIIGGELVVQDLGSSNGVFVNGKKVKKSLLVNNDRLKVGTTIFMATAITDDVADGRTFVGIAPSRYSKQTHDFKKLAKVLDAKITFNPDLKIQPPFLVASKPYELFLDIMEAIPANIVEDEYNSKELMNGYYFQIRITGGENEGDVFHFYRKKIIVGRTKDLWIYDKSVSREHAEITLEGPGVFKIKDLGSQNGTFLNGQRIQMATFRERDVVKLGDTVLSFAQLPEEF